jgi:WD40-like Beta Propeller Repeat
MARSLFLVAALVALLVAAAGPTTTQASSAAPAGGQGSILYLEGGRLWVASPDGRMKRSVRHTGRFESASQSDNGTIVAQRGVELHRLNRTGKPLTRPFTTAFRTSRLLPNVHGPFSPEISPDGKRVAYTYSFVASHFDPACMCQRTSPSMNTAYTWADRLTEAPEKVFGLVRFHSDASWIDNRTTLSATQHLYDYAGNVMDALGIDAIGGGPDSYRDWFSGCMAGCDSVQTLQLYRFAEPEMTRQLDKLVVVSGRLNGPADGSRMQIHRLTARPPAIPQAFCQISATSGKLTSPTWSPDGNSLAWADARGIWVGVVGNAYGPDGPACELRKQLLIPGGSKPDWGPARP